MTPEHIATLAALARQAGLSLLELEEGSTFLRLRFEAGASAPDSALETETPVSEDNLVVSPGVGTFLLRHPLMGNVRSEEGARVEKGAILGYVRAGTLFQAVRSHAAGRLGPALVAEGGPVAFGMPLFRLG